MNTIRMTFTSPLVMVIFGATGDLMHRRLMPALYGLMRDGAISRDTFIVGVGRRDINQDAFADLMAKSVQAMSSKDIDLPLLDEVMKHIHYVQGAFEDAKLYNDLTNVLTKFDEEAKACVPRFFYLATPPIHYETILTHLKDSKLSEGCGQGTMLYTRVLIEKPFGKDLDTARHLDQLLADIFEERQIYRIDHYLGKETTQNILSFRFANGIFEPTWNREFIDHIQITLAEDIGVGSRGEFYEGIGAIRDVVQNHMLEMLALIAMDQPRAFDAESIRDKRAEVLKAISFEHAVRGQYEGYTKEINVYPASTTETYVAAKLLLDTPRWKGVPFYLRTGKFLPKKMTQISIHYKKPIVCYGEVCLFPEPDVMRNVLAFTIDPHEKIVLRLMAKKPGYTMKLAPVNMTFSYSQSFQSISQPSAYERLLLDSIRGDQTLFARTDGIEASWSVITKILDHWRINISVLYPYPSGSWGPREADELIEKDGRNWFMGE